MSAPPSKTPPLLDRQQVIRGLHPLMLKGGLVLSAAIVLQYVGQWRLMAWALAGCGVRVGGNMLLTRVFRARFTATSVEWVRLALNGACQVWIGLGAGWSLLLWSYLPFSVAGFYGADRQGRIRAIVFVGFVNTVALLSGCDPFQPLAFTLIGGVSFLVTERRAELLQQSLEQSLAQREQLQRAELRLRRIHERAFEQEKLTSLGMMAAGVAHEINNPMSFVTSNVNSLLKDLKRQPELSEALKEYVEDVLPATLEGIKRVNAIVSDLQRFSLGDPEIHAEYDLNAEAEAALRIAQGQLSHCRVEVALRVVGKVVGRPRQIVQVLVNLLSNAGQATQPGGLVRLTTFSEGDGVGVEVRDTGEGMTPETLRNLFQPFFTTRPQGMGTGLGLAVAHGIITGQGGRIEVESEVGKGSCLTVHLPRVAQRASPSPSQGQELSGGGST